VEDDLGRNLSVGAFREFVQTHYNYYDQHFKLTKYKGLIDAGVPHEIAVDRIRAFSQDYASIKWWFRAGSEWTRPLVTSFPAEFARIGWNAITREPKRAASILSILPFINILGMARSGANFDRLDALLRARGSANGMDHLFHMVANWYQFDGDGNVRGEVNLGSFFDPGAFAGGHGPLKLMVDHYSRPEDRGFWGTAAASVAGVLSQFKFNNPVVNFGVGMATNLDPNTGRPIYPDDADPVEKFAALGKMAWQTLVPPLVGRDAFAIANATDLAENPKTGKPAYQRDPVGVAVRAVTGVGLKGAPAGRRTPLVDDESLVLSALYESRQELTGNRFSDQPLFSHDQEERTLAYRMIDRAATAAEKTAAEAKLRVMLGGKKKTGMEADQAIENYRKEGLEHTFARATIDQQALTIAKIDRAGVGDEHMRALVETMLHGESFRIRWQTDPGRVADAIRILRAAQENPYPSPRLTDLIEQLEIMRVRAEARIPRAQASGNRREVIRRAALEAHR